MVRSWQAWRSILAVVLIGPFIGGPWFLPRAARADETPSDSKPAALADDVGQLIDRLGDPSFTVRQEAAASLEALGAAVREPLTEALRHRDAEVRLRARKLLADILHRDYMQRLEAFAAGSAEASLAYWEKFRHLAGDDPAARKLFVEMHRAEGGLLETAENSPASIGEVVNQRLTQMTQRFYQHLHGRRQTAELGSIAALLLVAADANVSPDESPLNNPLWMNLIHDGNFQKAVREGERRAALRALLGQWLARPTHDQGQLQRSLMLSMQLDIKAGIRPALVALVQEKNLNPYIAAYALLAVGKLGGREHAAVAVPWLENKQVCSTHVINNQRRIETQLRDVALAVLVTLTGQDHREYGFTRLNKDANTLFSISTIGFEDEAQRRAALEKWQAWQSDHPLPEYKLDPPEAAPPAAGNARGAAPAAGANLQVVVGGAGVAVAQVIAGAKPAEDSDEDQDQLLGTMPLADRQQVQRLLRAAQWIEEGRWTEATAALGAILAEKQEFGFQPHHGRLLLRRLRSEARRMMDTLPPEGLAAYRLQFNDRARAELDAALAADSSAGLADVARRFFYTPAGASAVYLLGQRHMAQGQPLQALLRFEELRRAADHRRRYEPALSLHVAACWARLGKADRARQVVGDLRSVFGDEAVIGGRRQSLADEDSLLAQWIGPLREVSSADDWLLTRGNELRNRPASGGGPWLAGEVWQVQTASHPSVHQALRDLQEQFDRDHAPALPAAQPLVVGDAVLCRTPTHLRCLNLADGALRWESPADDALWHLLNLSDEAGRQSQASFIRDGLRQRVWEDTAFGTLSSDGRRVYAVEDLPFGVNFSETRMVVMPNGKRRLELGGQHGGNRLAAYDVATGKLCWELGGPPGDWGLELAGTWFLGPPLPLAGSLYALARAESQTQLLVLEAATGRVQWSCPLATAEADELVPVPMFAPGLVPQLFEPRFAGSPSYDQGVLVCPVSPTQYVAVDLAGREMLWSYRAAPRGAGPALRNINIWQRRQFQALFRHLEPRWSDCLAVIAGNRVLLAACESDELVCLRLTDGDFQWSLPREDGLCIAGVFDDTVLIVGSGALRAVSLEDGTPVWPQPRVMLPPGSLPAGRGFLADGSYYLPLSTGEVAQYRLADGDRLALIPGAAAAPGNLVPVDGHLVAQSAYRIALHLSLPARRGQLAEALRQRPEDARLRGDYGGVLLAEGRIAEAIPLLAEVARSEPADSPARRRLAEALLAGLEAGILPTAEAAEQLRPLLPAGPEGFAPWRQFAQALHRRGDLAAALDAYLKLVDIDAGRNELDFAGATWQARRARWLAVQLIQLRDAADEPLRRRLDDEVARRVADGRLEQVLAYFPRHPAADGARLELARQWRSGGDNHRIQAELLLWQLAHRPEAPQSAAAVAELARAWRDTGKHRQAAPLYRHLAGPLADTVVLDGMTGRQVVAALPADDPVRRWLDREPFWPAVAASAKVQQQRGGFQIGFALAVRRDGDPLAAPFYVETDQLGQNLTGYDPQGQVSWKASPAAQPQRHIHGGYSFTAAQGRQVGPLFVAWTGQAACAVDTIGNSGDKILWQVSTAPNEPFQIAGVQIALPIGIQLPSEPSHLAASDPQPVVITNELACFQQGDALVAVDLASGEVLWSRRDLPADSDLFGDDERLFVTGPDESTARVLSTLDGRDLGSRAVPALEQRMWTLGRKILCWTTDQNVSRLTLHDAWEQRVCWQREFSSAARPWPIDGDEVAVLEPTGQLTLLTLPDGRPILQTRLEAEPNLDNFHVVRTQREYLLAISRPGQPAAVVDFRFLHNSVNVNGRIVALRREGGEQLWSLAVESQRMKLRQPSDLPLLVLLNQWQEFAAQNRVLWKYALLAVDVRNGRKLHESSGEGFNHDHRLEIDPAKKTIELVTNTQRVQFQFPEPK